MREDKISSYLKISIWSLAVLALIVIAAVGIKYTYDQRYIRKIAELEEAIQSMQTLMSVESVRQYNIQRIVAIMDLYNKNMPNPQKYDIANEIYHAGEIHTNLDVDFICAVITYETNGTWEPEFISNQGGMGLLQIMPITALYIARSEGFNWISPEEALLNPIQNIRIGCKYLSALIETYDVDGALAAHNVGERRAARWIKSGRAYGILPRDVQEYIRRILAQYEKFKAFNL